MDTLLTLGFLLMLTVSIRARECNYKDFAVCMRDVNGLHGADFGFVDKDQMKEVCNSKMETIECASDFIQNCMNPGERDVYEATTGGRLKVVEQMCTDGTKINNGFLQHMSCFGRLQDEIDFCNEKFKESQTLLTKARMIDRLKVFYGCCAFEWHRNCLAKTARMKCNDEASSFMYYVTTVLGGEVQNNICKTSYSNCHGLHGIDQDEIDKKLENISDDKEEMDENLEDIYADGQDSLLNSSAFFTSTILQTVICLYISTCVSIMHLENYML